MKKPRPKIPNIYLTEVWDHPVFEEMPAVAAGALFRLIRHFVLTGCKSIPKSRHDLEHVCRSNHESWRKHRDSVMLVFNECRPGIEYAYGLALQKRESMRDALRLAGQISAGKRARKKLVDSNVTPILPDHASGVTPRREAEFIHRASEIRRDRWEEYLVRTGQAEAPKPPPAIRKFVDRI
jgi:hypothetical protein